MVERALAAAETLAAEGIEAEVIDLRWIRPLDLPTIAASVEQDRAPGHRRGAVARGRLGRDASSASWPSGGIDVGQPPPRAVSLPDDLPDPVHARRSRTRSCRRPSAIADAARATAGR